MSESNHFDLQSLPAWPQSQASLSDQTAFLIQVANRLGLYDAADAVKQLIPRLKEVRYGCHVDVDHGCEPDGCVIDAEKMMNDQSSITNQRPELWQEINRVWFSQVYRRISSVDDDALTSSAKQAADAILVIRNWLLPEENEPPTGEGEPWPMAYQQMSDARWEQRQALREVLTAEAEKAAQGAVQILAHYQTKRS